MKVIATERGYFGELRNEGDTFIDLLHELLWRYLFLHLRGCTCR